MKRGTAPSEQENGDFVYPAIPDEYRDAVLEASEAIRFTGCFNRETERVADEYGVDVDELRRLIRIRQGAGQRAAARNKAPIKFKYIVVRKAVTGTGESIKHDDYLDIEKGLSKETVQKRIDRLNHTLNAISAVGATYKGEVIAECETRDGAECWIRGWEARKEAQPADAEPARLGEWIKPIAPQAGIICSACRKYQLVRPSRFCPNCGAKMDATKPSDEEREAEKWE